MKIIEREENIVTIDYKALEGFICEMEAKLKRLHGDTCFYTEWNDHDLCMKLVDRYEVNEWFEEEGLPKVPYFKDYSTYEVDDLGFDDTIDLSDQEEVEEAISTWESLAWTAESAIKEHLSKLKQLVKFCDDID